MTELTLSLAEGALDHLAERIAENVVNRLNPGDGSSWLTVEQAADYLQTSGDSIRALVKRRKIPHHRAGGRLLFDRVELDGWVRGNQP